MTGPDTDEDDGIVYNVWVDVTRNNSYTETWLHEMNDVGDAVFVMLVDGVYHYHAFKYDSNNKMQPLESVKTMDEAKEVALTLWRMM